MIDSKGKNPTVAEYVSTMIDLSGKTQTKIATEVGFSTPNLVSMIKSGKSRMPIDKIGKFARALNVDPFYLYCLVMNEYDAKTFEVLQKDVFNTRMILSAEEETLISMLRRKVESGLSLDEKFKENFGNFLEQA